MEKITNANRIINYYELNFKFIEKNNPNLFFDQLEKLMKTRAKIKYQKFGDRTVFFKVISNKDSLVKAKMYSVRTDLLPEIINMKTDETKGIEAQDYEGIVETTHFIVDIRKSKVFLALEYNHQGSKIGDFVNYLQRVGLHKKMVSKVNFEPIVEHDLASIKKRMNRISELTLKIHKDYIPKLKKVSTGVYESAHYSQKHFDSDNVTLVLKFDYKESKGTKGKVQEQVDKLFAFLKKNNKNKHIMNKLIIKAEDEQKNNRLETFDLLIEKINSQIKVQRIPKYRTLVSVDMFEKMTKELRLKQLK
jgi:hypothetical protein